MSDDPYMECPVYAKHGACSCSTGVYGNTCRLPGGLGEPECEEHHIPLTLHIGRVEEADENAGEVGEYLACRLCVALDAVYDLEHRALALSHDNHRLRAAIGRHRDRIMSLGHDGKGKHGSEWDRDLWDALYAFAGRCQGCEDGPVGVAVVHDPTCPGCLPDDEPKCAQETAGFGPPCSDPLCEACRG